MKRTIFFLYRINLYVRTMCTCHYIWANDLWQHETIPSTLAVFVQASVIDQLRMVFHFIKSQQCGWNITIKPPAGSSQSMVNSCFNQTRAGPAGGRSVGQTSVIASPPEENEDKNTAAINADQTDCPSCRFPPFSPLHRGG